jgi:hypothetical protein
MAKPSKTATPATKATKPAKEGHRQEAGRPKGRGALGA